MDRRGFIASLIAIPWFHWWPVESGVEKFWSGATPGKMLEIEWECIDQVTVQAAKPRLHVK